VPGNTHKDRLMADFELKDFELYTHRRHMARLFARYELFKKVLHSEGSIIECGVHNGAGVLAWAKMSETFEPYAIRKKVFGFDTFSGFPSINEYDHAKNVKKPKAGEFKTESFDNIVNSINTFENSRHLKQFPKIELVKGDATKTIPEFLENNQHLIISILFLDFDLYEPTKIALEHFLPRMPKGSILAFDEVNEKEWPGETLALVNHFGSLNNLKIERFPFDSNISYITI
jgi:hypothetical protein